jgi:predicted kinase
VILVGLQASGKSTFYRERLADTHVQVSKDLFRSARDKPKRQREEIDRALAQGRNVAVDNMNLTRFDRALIVQQARGWGARVTCYYLESTLGQCQARNARRTGRAQVPEVALCTAATRLEPPEPSECFDGMWRVRLKAGGGFLVSAWEDETPAV